MMPRISGFDACQKLRKDPATADIGIIMVTALDQPADIDRAVASGTDDMITKPVNRHDLIARVHGLLAAKASKNGTADRFLAYIDRVEQVSK
jgi:DNA-binding response OmpR family regulator